MDKHSSIPIKWGDYTICNNVFEAYTSSLPTHFAADIVLLDISMIDQEEIDKMIDICDYCGQIYKKFVTNGE